MKPKWFCLFVIFIFLCILGVFWLALCFLTFASIFLLVTSNFGWAITFRKKRWLYLPSILSIVILIAICLRIFVFDVFKISSNSMEASLLVGDRIMVSKLHYGPRFPKSPFEIPWINLFFCLNKDARARIDFTWWGYKRYNGFSRIKNDDIIVFNRPEDTVDYYVKRCIGRLGVLYHNL